jgi:hypothetical protein
MNILEFANSLSDHRQEIKIRQAPKQNIKIGSLPRDYVGFIRIRKRQPSNY